MALIRRSIPVANFALTALIAAAVAFGVVAAEPVQSENAGGGKVVGGGKKTVRAARSSAASASPRVTADVLHRCSMDAANAWGVVIDGKPGPRFFNYQVQLVVTPKGTWLACWTQGTIEAAADQRVVVARSLDGGRSWSSEIAVEEAGGDYRVPAWGVPFVVPGSGRIYVFYWFNYNNVKLRDAGDIFFRFSDDDGVHWSPRRRIGVPRTDMDRGEPGDLHGWNFGQPRIFPGGQVIFTYTKIRRSSLYPEGWRLTADNRWQPDGSAKVDPARPPGKEGGSPNNWATEVFFVEMPNILSERDPTKLEFRFLPKGGSGLWAPYPKTDRHFGQEGTLTALSGGRLLCVFRTRQGHPFYAVSSDHGETWTKPEPLRLRPGGEAFNQRARRVRWPSFPMAGLSWFSTTPDPRAGAGIRAIRCGFPWAARPRA